MYIMDPPDDRKILCNYFNATSELQILQLSNSPTNNEEVICPNERCFFEANPDSVLKVYRQTFTGRKDLVDCLRCQYLKVLNSIDSAKTSL